MATLILMELLAIFLFEKLGERISIGQIRGCSEEQGGNRFVAEGGQLSEKDHDHLDAKLYIIILI